MRIGILGALLLISAMAGKVSAQQICGSADYQQKVWLANPAIKPMVENIVQ